MPFPATRHSVLEVLREGDDAARREAFGVLFAAYGRPVYKLLRVKWNLGTAEAEDLTQQFFLIAWEKGWFRPYDPSRARFRTFLRTCLDGFAANEHKAATRLKRGGGVALESLDQARAETELESWRALGASASVDPDEFFRKELARSLVSLAIEDVKRTAEERGRERAFRLFEQYDLEGVEGAERPTYASLAAEHGLSVTQVTNTLHAVRRDLRRAVLARLRETTGGEEEFRAEARELLGIEVTS